MKKCNGCGSTKERNDFYKNRSRKDGLATQCKVCQLSYSDKWYGKHADRKKHYYAERLSDPEIRERYRESWRKAWAKKTI